MRTLDNGPAGDAMLVLEAGDSIEVHEGEVLVVIAPPPSNPEYTLKEAAK